MPDELVKWIAKVDSNGEARGRARGVAEGRAIGVAEGRAEGVENTALNMLRDPEVSLSDEFVARVTGLSIKKVRQMRKSLNTSP